MLLSRFRQGNKKRDDEKEEETEQLQAFLDKRDYASAISLLEYERSAKDKDSILPTLLWLGYCHFHASDYRKASKVLKEAIREKSCPNDVHLYLACAYFFEGMYEEANREAEKGSTKSALQNRLLMHIAHKLNDEKRLMGQHSQLRDTVENQMCLASLHYMRSHYQQAIDIYKGIIAQYPEYLAVNFYLALCYYKLDDYDAAMEALLPYLDDHKDSRMALNLKSCIYYRLHGAKAGEKELAPLAATTDDLNIRDILIHNMVVFRNGDGGTVLSSLMDRLPEARLNLAIYHLRRNDPEAAFAMLEHVEPQCSAEFILKGCTYLLMSAEKESADHLRAACESFLAVGSSPAECDTIAGRQSMASALFLQGKYDEVLVYLRSIQSFFSDDDIFNWNFGYALMMCGEYEEAESALLHVKQHNFTSSTNYLLSLARTYIANGKARLAWGLYQKVKHLNGAPGLLKLIANDCYMKAEYLMAARCFIELKAKEPRAGYNEPKRASLLSVVRSFANGETDLEEMRETLAMLRQEDNSWANDALSIIEKWASDCNIYLE